MVDASLKKIDKNNMYERINSFFQQILDGITIGKEARLGNLPDMEFDNIVLAGMGGSAIAGDLLKSILRDELKIPFTVHRNYGLPEYVGKDSLVICSSYSGNTEETLSAFQTALERGCSILCISTGGMLSEYAEKNNIPLIKIPSGMMPREALGLSLTPLLITFGRLGFVRDYSTELSDTAGYLRNLIDEYKFEAPKNIAFELAVKLTGKIVVIYAGPDWLDSAALRFKGQICENAKQLAFCNVFPEFNHNELVGWELSGSFSDKYVVLIIHDKGDHPQIVKRMKAVSEILSKNNIEVIELFSRGDSLLTRILSIVQLADYTSYYLALKNRVDPTPIRLIDYLKEKITENRGNK